MDRENRGKKNQHRTHDDAVARRRRRRRQQIIIIERSRPFTHSFILSPESSAS